MRSLPFAHIVYSAHPQKREGEEALMLEVVAGLGLALVVGDAGAALAAFAAAAVERVRRKGERID